MMKKILFILIIQINSLILAAQTCKVSNVDLVCLNGLWETVLQNSSVREFTLYNNTKFIKITYNQKAAQSNIFITEAFMGFVDYDLKFGDTIDIRTLKMKGKYLVTGEIPIKGFSTNFYSCDIMDIYCDAQAYEQGGSVCLKKTFIPLEVYTLLSQKGLIDKQDYINKWGFDIYIPLRKVAVEKADLINDDSIIISLKINDKVEIVEEKFSKYKVIYNGDSTKKGWLKKSDLIY